MSVVQLDFYDREDLNGTPLLSIDDEDVFLEGFEMRVSLRDLGSGLITLSRQGVSAGDNPSFLFDVARAESFVRVLVPAISSDYLFGFFLDSRKTQVLSPEESSGMDIIIGGSGPLYYLSRAILWNEKFSGTAATVDEETGLWTFPDNSNWNAGKVFETLLAEDSNNTLATFLPDLTLGFDDALDSNGDAWTDLFDGGLELEIGTHYLQALRIMQEQADDLDATMHLGAPGAPLMRLDMYNRLGRDLTGSTMGAGVVLFKAGIDADPKSGNILTGLEATGHSTLKPSHVLVRGADGVYSQVDRSLWSAGDFTKAVAVDYQETSGETSLFRYGRRIMADWDARSDAQQLEIHPGFDPANGLYMPGPDGSDGHFWIGDDITLKTGGDAVHSVLDYHYTTERVTGIRMVLDQVADGSTDAKAALSWHVVPELNEVYGLPGGDLNRGVASRHDHPPNPRLCVAGDPGIPPTYVSVVGDLGDLGTSNNMVADVPSDVAGAAWYAVVVDTGGGTIGAQWQHDATDPGTREAMTLIDSETVGSLRMSWFRLLDPTPTTGASAHVRVTDSAGQERLTVAWYLTGVNQSDPDDAPVFANDVGGTSSVTIPTAPHQLALNAAAWFANNQTGMGNPTPGGGQTSSFADSVDRPAGQPDSEAGAGRGASVPTWTFSSSQAWLAGGLAVSGEAGTANDGLVALVGTSNRAARCDHRHDYHSTSSPTTANNAAAGFIHDGLIWAQLDDLTTPTEIIAIWMLVDAENGTWLAWPGGTAGSSTVTDHGTMGATEEFDAAVHDHEGTQDANLTVTLTGATDGEAAWLTLVLTQDGSGGHTLTLPASVVNASPIEAAWDTDAGATNILTLFSYDGGTTWYGALAGADGGIVDAGDVRDAGRWEVVVDGNPAAAVTTEDGSDWVYGWVPGS